MQEDSSMKKINLDVYYKQYCHKRLIRHTTFIYYITIYLNTTCGTKWRRCTISFQNSSLNRSAIKFCSECIIISIYLLCFHSFSSHPFVHWIHLSNIDDAICAWWKTVENIMILFLQIFFKNLHDIDILHSWYS